MLLIISSMRLIVISVAQILLQSLTTETAIRRSILTIPRTLTAMLLILRIKQVRLQKPISMTLLVLKRILTRMTQMRSVTAVSILMLKRVRFILGRDTTIRVQVDLSAVTPSQAEGLIRLV